MTRSPSARRHLKERCLSYRAALLEAQLVPEEEIARIWPGSAENPTTDIGGWIYAHFNLGRFFGRTEARDEFAGGASDSRSDQVLHLQQGTTRVVRLLRPIDQEGTLVDELPLQYKSFSALRRLATYARITAQLLVHIVQLETRPEHQDLVLEAQEWRARILLMLIWGATFDSPGLPWDPSREPWPELPAWLDTLDTTDVLAVQLAFTEQYGRALLSISPFIAPSDEEKDPLAGWETFFASYATEKGLEAHRLMQDRAFLPFLTQVSLAAHASRQAREAAAADAPAAAGVA